MVYPVLFVISLSNAAIAGYDPSNPSIKITKQFISLRVSGKRQDYEVNNRHFRATQSQTRIFNFSCISSIILSSLRLNSLFSKRLK